MTPDFVEVELTSVCTNGELLPSVLSTLFSKPFVDEDKSRDRGLYDRGGSFRVRIAALSSSEPSP